MKEEVVWGLNSWKGEVCWRKQLRIILYSLCPRLSMYVVIRKVRSSVKQILGGEVFLQSESAPKLNKESTPVTCSYCLRFTVGLHKQKGSHHGVVLLHCLQCIANASLSWVNGHWVHWVPCCVQESTSPIKSVVLKIHALLILPPLNLSAAAGLQYWSIKHHIWRPAT